MSSDCHDFSDIMESGLVTLECILLGPIVPQVISDLIFSYSGRDFAPPVPTLRSIHLRGMEREIASED